MTTQPNYARKCALVLAFALACTAPTAAIADEPASTSAAPATAAPQERFFELRIYTAAPGKLDALNKRFRDHTLKFFEKHGIESIGYWTAADDSGVGKLYYIVAYPDQASREKSLINGVAKDPGFLAVVAESEKDGKLVEKTESVLLKPTDYSAIK
jgi:hypothetical protein